MKLLVFISFMISSQLVYGQTYFNAWLTTCSHLKGPTGNPNTLKVAVDQSRGLHENVPGFAWDILVDLGDWTASQKPPDVEDGIELSKILNDILGEDRGRFFTIAGNHDGDRKGWYPGEFTQKYVNPLGDEAFSQTSGFSAEQREKYKDLFQLIDYPGTGWDRYLVRSGNVVWIMLSDRNEYDELAESRGDTSGRFQAGRGSEGGMPDGGYPSGSVTLSTFKWWKKVVEDPLFSDDILITAHHILPANTAIATKAGEIQRPSPDKQISWNKVFHGLSGSAGPEGSVGGQLYWIREYDDRGKEIKQYAQTRPFMDYLRDNPGAVAAWLGGHTHVDYPEYSISGRGIFVRKYDVTFINVGALTDSHGGGEDQMSRLVTFEHGSDEAVINVFIHSSKSGDTKGWYDCSVRKFSLGKKFICPENTSNAENPVKGRVIRMVPDAPAEPFAPRYYWDLDQKRDYDFNNLTDIVGADGSPYGKYQMIRSVKYSEDTPLKRGKSLDLSETQGRVVFNGPYQPEMDWKNLTISLWLKTYSDKPQEVLSYSSSSSTGKFRLWFDGNSWIWDVAEGDKWKSARWKTSEDFNIREWKHFLAVVDSDKQRIQLYVDAKLVAEENWTGTSLNPVSEGHQLVLGATGEYNVNPVSITWSRPFEGLIDEIMIFDKALYPDEINEIVIDK